MLSLWSSFGALYVAQHFVDILNVITPLLALCLAFSEIPKQIKSLFHEVVCETEIKWMWFWSVMWCHIFLLFNLQKTDHSVIHVIHVPTSITYFAFFIVLLNSNESMRFALTKIEKEEWGCVRKKIQRSLFTCVLLDMSGFRLCLHSSFFWPGKYN